MVNNNPQAQAAIGNQVSEGLIGGTVNMSLPNTPSIMLPPLSGGGAFAAGAVMPLVIPMSGKQVAVVGASLANARGERKKDVVIGESMDRIKKIGKKRGLGWYKGWNKGSFDDKLRRNEAWIRKVIRQGRRIFDAGIDKNKNTRSPFYKMENDILNEKKYPTTPI